MDPKDSERAPRQERGQVNSAEVGRRRLISGGLSAVPVLMAMKSRSALATTCLTPSRMMSGNMSASNPDQCFALGYTPEFFTSPENFDAWPIDSALPPSLQKCTASAVFEKKSGVCSKKTSSTWGEYDGGTVPALDDFAAFLIPDCPNGNRDYPGGPYAPPSNPVTKRATSFGTAFADVFVNINSGFVPKLPTYLSDSAAPAPADPLIRGVSLWELLAYPSWAITPPSQLDLARCCITAYLNALILKDKYPVTAQQAIDMWRDGRVNQYCALSSCTTPLTANQIVAYLTQTWTL